MIEIIFRIFTLLFVGLFLPDASWKLGQYFRLHKFGILNEPLYNVKEV